MCSPRLVEVHFWLAIMGTVIYVFAMWNSGILQGLMWRTYTEEGHAATPSSTARGDASLLHRPRVGRAAFPHRPIGLYNVLMTIRRVP